MSNDPRPEISLKPIKCNFRGFRQSYKRDIYSQLLPGDGLQGEIFFLGWYQRFKVAQPTIRIEPGNNDRVGHSVQRRLPGYRSPPPL